MSKTSDTVTSSWLKPECFVTGPYQKWVSLHSSHHAFCQSLPDGTGKRPVDQPFERPIERPVEKPLNRPFERPTRAPVIESSHLQSSSPIEHSGALNLSVKHTSANAHCPSTASHPSMGQSVDMQCPPTTSNLLAEWHVNDLQCSPETSNLPMKQNSDALRFPPAMADLSKIPSANGMQCPPSTLNLPMAQAAGYPQ